ncbi:MAG: S8 family peptidase [Holophagales bacterium]|nr:S8 family peptidase [Holophagales bacterium]
MHLRAGFVHSLIFGPRDGGGSVRFTQDSPVLPDVWQAYGRDPAGTVDLLLTPHIQSSAGVVGAEIRRRLEQEAEASSPPSPHSSTAIARVAYNQFHVVARLRFDQLVRLVLPLTTWWHEKVGDQRKAFLEALSNQEKRDAFALVLEDAFNQCATHTEQPAELLWISNLVGAVAWAHEVVEKGEVKKSWLAADGSLKDPSFVKIANSVKKMLEGCREENLGRDRSIWSVNRNRVAEPCIGRSVPAIKADAARHLFDIRCEDLAWAVLDSGIDARHPAFRDHKAWKKAGNEAREEEWWKYTRVTHTYDFRRIRDLLDPTILSRRGDQRAPWLQRALDEVKERRLEEHRKLFGPDHDAALEQQIEQEVGQALKDLERHLTLGWQINWGLLEPFLRISHGPAYPAPDDEHGTHVAGILGAGKVSREPVSAAAGSPPSASPPGSPDAPMADSAGALTAAVDAVQGVCPDIRLYDLRVLGEDGDEFSVISALQFVAWLNGHRDYLVVHGANLSLSILHEVESYACGATPVCEEADRLASSGVVVVAAAGNQGHHTFRTNEGPREGYLSASITDPGNANKVITVGSTHRYSPHTYGVSYFSGRGPTGDGRAKPDLVAPGEKIRGPLPDAEWGRKDGTSMAAPHVSGAAALLMARHTELMGKADRVKAILLGTCTDLGRERYFQGHGMVDVLRALQSV